MSCYKWVQDDYKLSSLTDTLIMRWLITECYILLTSFHYCTIKLLASIKLLLKWNVISTASPSMRGSTPLDVAAASVMDNNELALALREPDLEKVGSYFIMHIFIPFGKAKFPLLRPIKSRTV